VLVPLLLLLIAWEIHTAGEPQKSMRFKPGPLRELFVFSVVVPQRTPLIYEGTQVESVTNTNTKVLSL
jgi:hypothetical protein